MNGDNHIVDMSGRPVMTKEEAERQKKEQYLAMRGEMERNGMPILDEAVEWLIRMQSLSNMMGLYETHRIFARMGVRSAWTRCESIGHEVTMEQYVDTGKTGMRTWSDSAVDGDLSKARLLQLLEMVTQCGRCFLNLHRFRIVQGDVVLMIARLEEAKELMLVEYSEIVESSMVIKSETEK